MANNQNKLIIVDGNSIFYRSFYALPMLKNPQGQPCNAIYGFFIELVKIIQNYNPTHLAIAFDKTRSAYRTQLYAHYKATRKSIPEELKSQLVLIRECLDKAGVKYFAIDGIEGDDVVGSLARRFEKECETLIISSDRDLFQLISDHTKMLYVRRGMSDVKLLDANGLEELFGYRPEHVVDIKALAGDPSDNIPGVAGIGDKGALELIAKYGTIENVLSNIDEIKTRPRNMLLAGEEAWRLSRKLATIITDAPLGNLKLDDLTYTYPFNAQTKAMFTEFGFRTLISKKEIFEDPSAQMSFIPQVVEEKTSYEKIQTLAQLNSVIAKVQDAKECALVLLDKTYIAFSGSAFMIDKSVLSAKENYCLDKAIVKGIIACPNVKKYLLDNKAARMLALTHGESLCGEYFDLMIAEHLISGKVIKYVEDSFTKSSTIDRIGIDMLPLCKKAESELVREKLDKLYYDLELPLSEVLFSMSVDGFKVNCENFIKVSEVTERELNKISNQIFSMVGVDFNLRSPKQLADLLFGKLGLPNRHKGSTNVDVLEELRPLHPVIDLILAHRKLGKFMGTYLDGFLPYISFDGYVHTVFNQTLTNTGRLSSSEPNLQNIPVRGEESMQIRSLFSPRGTDYVLIDADYSQIELRLLAAFSGDEKMIDAFKSGRDIHTETASNVFNVPLNEVTAQMRRIAKIVNFGVIYGISGYGLAQDLKISAKQAKEYIDSFFALHPKVKEYMDSIVVETKKTGRVYTMLGRYRDIDAEINAHNFMIRSSAERAAQNMPLQGSAADIIKMAMLGVYRRLEKENLKAKLICQVHDELVIDCPKDEEERVKKLLKEEMENVVKLAVPMEVEIASGSVWMH